MKRCTICLAEFDEAVAKTVYAEAGEWLAGDVWNDPGQLCPQCLENRAKLAMMYCNEFNT